MPRTFHLHGKLAELAGTSSIQLAADRPYTAARGLSQLPALRQHLRDNKVAYISEQRQQGHQLNERFIDDDVHLVSEVEGSGLETFAAIGAYFGATGTAAMVIGAVVYVGVMMAISYLTMALAPTPDGTGAEKAEQHDSFVWQGVSNVMEQGHPVPLVYGTFMTGSVVVSSDWTVDEERLTKPVPPPTPGRTARQPSTTNNESSRDFG